MPRRVKVMLVAPSPEQDYPLAAVREAGWDARSVHADKLATTLARRRATRSLLGSRGPDIVHVESIRQARELHEQSSAAHLRLVTTLSTEDAIDAEACGGDLPFDACCVENTELRSLLRRRGDARTGPVTVIPAVPDAGLLQVPGGAYIERGDDTPIRILSVGPLSWTQGYEHSLLALKLLRDRGILCQYRIAGRGTYRDPLQFARHQLGLDDCVELIEPSSRQQLRRLFAWADVLVDPSVAPTSRKAMLDAHAAGVPVVSSHPLADVESTVAATRRDPESLRAAVMIATHDVRTAREVISRGRALARRVSEQTRATAGLDRLYRHALEAR